MLKTIRFLMGGGLFTICAAVLIPASAGPVDFPKEKGPANGPRILLMHGARPWRAGEDSALLVKAGARVTNLSSVYMDGLGSSIKVFWSDKVEPEAKNGLDLAFDRLADYDLLFVHEIPSGNIDKIFTPDRVEKVRAFVENGGRVLFAMETPTTLGELSPVRTTVLAHANGRGVAERPAGVAFDAFEKIIPVRGAYRKGSLSAGAECLSTIRDADGNELAPFVAVRRIGRGAVFFANIRIVLPNDPDEFVNWAYGKAFFCALASAAMDRPLASGNCVEWLEAIPPKREVGEAHASLLPPELRIDEDEAPAVDGSRATFANGIVLSVMSNGTVRVSWPGAPDLMRKLEIPKIEPSKRQVAELADESFEAVNREQQVALANVAWSFAGMETRGRRLVLKYTADRGELQWTFKSGTLHLDGRTFAGLAEAAGLVRFDGHVEAVHFAARLAPPEPLFARRFSCYTPPRGYSEFDLSGAADVSTGKWTAFGSGQPFALLVCRNAVYAETPTAAEPGGIGMSRKAGAAEIEATRSSTLGRVRAPCASSFWWHWFSTGPERGHNDYLALYQFVRKSLRAKYGLKELPACPMSTYDSAIGKDHKSRIAAYSKEKGYRYLEDVLPESPVEHIVATNRLEVYRQLCAAGVVPAIWSSGGYTQALENKVCRQHPEWLVRDPKGKPMQYFGNYPVFDIQNPAYFAWYTNILTTAREYGVGWVYRDMDGAANDNIDYSKDCYPACSEALVRYYRFFHSLGMRVSLEGMNPLIIDQYWFRKENYTPFAGNEFCLVGGVPSASGPAGVTLDAFRTGMYGAFVRFDHAGVVAGVDRYPEEVARAKKADALVPVFTAALDLCGMPYVRETDFGTVWTGDNGGAIFFWNPTARAVVDLPEGWRIRGVEGNVLTNVPGETVYLVSRDGDE